MPDDYYGAHVPGEQLSELDSLKWAEWEDSFFDLELALQEDEKAKQPVPQGKRKPKRKTKAPVSVKRVRASAFQHIKALDKTCETMLGEGLTRLQVDYDNEGEETKYDNPLINDEQLPDTLVLHLDEGSSAFAMTWHLSFMIKLLFIPMRDMFRREWKDIRLALGDCRLWCCVLLTTMVFNLPCGPLESSKW